MTGDASHHRGIDGTWTDRIDSYLGLGILQGCGPRQANHSMFTRHVCCSTSSPYQTRHRRGINDGSLSLLKHLGNFVLHTQPHALEVDGDHSVPRLFGIVDGRGCTPFNPRVVMRTIQPTVASNGLGNHGFDLSSLRHIGFDEYCLAAVLLNQTDRLFAPFDRYIGDHDFRPFTGKGESRGSADPRT